MPERTEPGGCNCGHIVARPPGHRWQPGYCAWLFPGRCWCAPVCTLLPPAMQRAPGPLAAVTFLVTSGLSMPSRLAWVHQHTAPLPSRSCRKHHTGTAAIPGTRASAHQLSQQGAQDPSTCFTLAVQPVSCGAESSRNCSQRGGPGPCDGHQLQAWAIRDSSRSRGRPGTVPLLPAQHGMCGVTSPPWASPWCLVSLALHFLVGGFALEQLSPTPGAGMWRCCPEPRLSGG